MTKDVVIAIILILVSFVLYWFLLGVVSAQTNRPYGIYKAPSGHCIYVFGNVQASLAAVTLPVLLASSKCPQLIEQ